MTLFLGEVAFEGLLELKMSPYGLFNILYVQILIWDQNNFARVTSEPFNPFKGSIDTIMVDDLSSNRTSRFKLFWFRVFRCFRVVYYVILSYFCLSMNLESFGTFSGSIGIYYQLECKEVRELADRSRHSSRPIGPSDAIWQKLRRSDAHSAKRSRAGNKFGIGSADRSSLVADRSPSLLISHLTAPIDRQACRSVA